MTRKFVIVGAGSFAQIVDTYVAEYLDGDVVAFAVNREFLQDEVFLGRRLIAIEDLCLEFPQKEVEIFVAIGYRKMNQVRAEIFEYISDLGFQFLTFIHPKVKIWDSCSIGKNVFIFEDNTIQPFTSIGDNSILWSGNHLGHHSIIGRNVFVSSHVVISGNCKVGDNCFIGVNATIHDGIQVDSHALIGAGAIVGKNVHEYEVIAPSRTKTFPKKSFELDF
jgi:sugar O-acyltransferase (sialic acid O-acetyltransferase NeuD family)